jgi:histidinol-phosphate/aromatic aminotransferase/cobyric acid decarboxylase-like protein
MTDRPVHRVYSGDRFCEQEVADEWVLLLCLALIDPGDEVITAQGSFISYLLRATEVGAKLTGVPLKDHTHDLDAMADAITDRTRLIFVCNPNNPTDTQSMPQQWRRFWGACQSTPQSSWMRRTTNTPSTPTIHAASPTSAMGSET